MVEGIIYRYRCGIAWRDLPEVFGPWRTVWTWHHRMATEGTWDRVLATLTAAADESGLLGESKRCSDPERAVGELRRLIDAEERSVDLTPA